MPVSKTSGTRPFGEPVYFPERTDRVDDTTGWKGGDGGDKCMVEAVANVEGTVLNPSDTKSHGLI